MAKFTRQRGQQIQTEIEKQRRQYKSRRIDEAVQSGYEKLNDGDLPGLGILIRDILIPDMGVSLHTLRSHANTVRDSPKDLTWDHTSIRSFVENPDRHIRAVSSSDTGDAKAAANQCYLRAAGMQDPRERHRDTVRDAFLSLESLAVVKNYVSNSVTNWAPARGYELQIGTWYQPPRDDMPYDIQLVNPGDSEEVTVNMGKPGRGKGVMGHTEAEDRFAAGRKVVDLIDFDECEGAVYDIPMSNPTLREVREDMGLPADFTGVDGYTPKVEIMVPITEGLEDKYIPYHGDGPEDTVVRPFTVPASHLSKKALKRFISGELTKTNKNIFETAYDQIQRSTEDWTLHDLIMSVERQRGLHGNQGAVDRVQRAIKRVASKGWIRSEDDPNAIDWERILTDPDTITVFTASLMPDTDEAAKFLFHSYVIYAFRKELKALKSLPNHVAEERGIGHVSKMQAILRELHNVAPNGETASDDPTIREIQEAMTSDFRDLTAMHRHEGVEVTADTQNFIGEIKKRARVNFNRAALFSVDFSPAKQMFEEMAGEPRDQYPRTVTRKFGVGECAVLGRVGTGRSFEMTVHVAPPMSHHFDPDEWVHPERKITKDRETLMKDLGEMPEKAADHPWISVNSGWDLRVHLLDEEYRPARELLEAAGAVGSPEDVDLTAVKTEQKRPEDGAGQYAWDALEIDQDGRATLDHVEKSYLAYAELNGFVTNLSRQGIMRRVQAATTPETHDRTFGDVMETSRPTVHEHPDGRRQTAVYHGVRLKPASEWLDCCDDPEFQLTWDPAPVDEIVDREDWPDLDGWTCGNCHGEGVTEDPAADDMDCCGSPRPAPVYGADGESQTGWKCENCGDKEWL